MNAKIENIKIREAVPDDIEILCGLLIELFTIEDDFTPDVEKHRLGISMLIDAKTNGIILVAESYLEIQGMVNLQKIASTAEGGYSVLIEDLYVKREYRGRGVGRMLIERALQWAKNEGALRVQLAADMRNNPALSFYSNAGFNMSNLIMHYKKLR